MPVFLFKSILGVVFFVTALISFLTMLILMGRPEQKSNPKTLKIIHKASGFLFLILLIVISIICIEYWIMAGDQISSRAAFHSFIALILIAVFFIKITIAQFFKPFLKFMPVMGIIVMTLVFVVTMSSAGYYFLKTASQPTQGQDLGTIQGKASDEQKGQKIYEEKCIGCHFPDKLELKNGPGLKDLFNNEFLPSSGKPATVENIKNQLITPYMFMPSFRDLREKELENLLKYLQML